MGWSRKLLRNLMRMWSCPVELLTTILLPSKTRRLHVITTSTLTKSFNGYLMKKCCYFSFCVQNEEMCIKKNSTKLWIKKKLWKFGKIVKQMEFKWKLFISFGMWFFSSVEVSRQIWLSIYLFHIWTLQITILAQSILPQSWVAFHTIMCVDG